MRVAFTLLAGFLTSAAGGCSQGAPAAPGAPQVKRSPEQAATIHRLPLSGLSRGPLSSPATKEARAATQAAKDLFAYYHDQQKEPAWQDAVRRLSAADPTERMHAATYLRDLLDQALKDELTGVGPLQMQPFWGGRGYQSSPRAAREDRHRPR
jgi:hypothetical protein